MQDGEAGDERLRLGQGAAREIGEEVLPGGERREGRARNAVEEPMRAPGEGEVARLPARREGLGRQGLEILAAGLGLANHEAIAAAKAGLEGLVRSAAATYAATGLRVNAIAPALTETPLTASMVASDAVRKAVTAMHPLGRLGTADDQAAAIAFLLSPAAGWITGQVLGVDGGLGRVRAK